MDPDDAAKKWIEANPDKVEAWLELSSSSDPRELDDSLAARPAVG